MHRTVQCSMVRDDGESWNRGGGKREITRYAVVYRVEERVIWSIISSGGGSGGGRG